MNTDFLKETGWVKLFHPSSAQVTIPLRLDKPILVAEAQALMASVTSLLQSDVSFNADEQLDLLVTIDEESDRLNRVVANLLDMSRLQANALEPSRIPTEVDDVVAGVYANLSLNALIFSYHIIHKALLRA